MSLGAADVLSSLDDNTLAAELVRGRHEALTVIFKRYSGAVFRVARRIVGHSGEAEEVVQQVFFEVYRDIAQFDSNKGAFSSWLLRRAKFHALNRKDHLNTERFYDWTDIDEATEAAASVDNRYLHQQEINPIVSELLEKLGGRRRIVVDLTFFGGLTANEVANEMTESVHVVRHLLYDALKQLRLAATKETATKRAKAQ